MQKVIKLRLDEEIAWLAGIHPRKRVQLLKLALSKLTRDEIFEVLGISASEASWEEANIEHKPGKAQLQEFENW